MDSQLQCINHECVVGMTSSTNLEYFECGSCEIIFGPMFAGKSTRLSSELTESADIGLKCLYINHSSDERKTEFSSDLITSHSSQFQGLSSKVQSVKTFKLSDVNVDKYHVIGIDEAQFFGLKEPPLKNDLYLTVRKWVLEKKKIVKLASLDGNFRMEPFGHAHELISICDPGNIIKLGARCTKCMVREKPFRHFRLIDAGFTMKKSGSGDDVEVGGADLYDAVCMKCHLEQI